MKKLLLGCLIVLLMSSAALADWSITTTWTRSVGPGLDHEAVFLDTTQKCSVISTGTTSCQFNVPTLSNQLVFVRSFNAQGAYSDTAPITLNAAPAAASNVMVNITYVSP
jgi:hypothetical protein